MKRTLLSFSLLSLLLFSCSKPKPGDVALNFYKAIISDDLATAKTFCLPSAIEEIDRLEKIEAFKRNVNKGIMEIMEVVLKNQDFQEGDTARVNYKIVDYKNFLTLVFKEKNWMIAMSPALKQLPVLEFESSEFTDKALTNHEIFWENYKNMYFVITSAAVFERSFESSVMQSAIPYSKEKNIIYANQRMTRDENMPAFLKNVKKVYSIFGKEVSYNPNITIDNYDCNYIALVIGSLSATDKEKLKFADESALNDPKWEQYSSKNYSINNIVTFRGELVKEEFQFFEVGSGGAIYFNNCVLLDITSE